MLLLAADHAAQHALVPANMIDPADISAMIAAGADIHTLRFDFTAVRSVSVICRPGGAVA
jgi:hypothetical protein